MKLILAALTLAALTACSTSSPTSSSGTQTPALQASASPDATPSPSASAAPGMPVGSPVPQQTLSPATEAPVAQLCSAVLQVLADGNAVPLQCSRGEVNVLAWSYYASVSADVLALGLNPTPGQVQGAICADVNVNHASKPQEGSGYKLAAAYYGWTFPVDPTQVMYKPPYCAP